MNPDDGRVVSNFIVQATKAGMTSQFTVAGDLRSRSFQYVDDLVEGMIRTMNTSEDNFTGPVNFRKYQLENLLLLELADTDFK